MTTMQQIEAVSSQGEDSSVSSLLIAKAFMAVIAIGLILFSFNLVIPRWEVLVLYDSKRVFVCALVVGCALAYLVSTPIRRNAIAMWRSLSRPIKAALIVLTFAMLISNAMGTHWLAAFIQQFYLIGLVLLAILLAPLFARSKPQLLRLFVLINILLFLSVAVMFWGVTLTGNSVSIFSIFSFVNPRFLNHMQIWTVLPVAYLAVVELQRRKRATTLRVILVLLFATSFATDARGVLLSMSVGFLVLVRLDVSRRKLWWKLLWQSIVFGFAFKYFALAPFPQAMFGEVNLTPELRVSSSGRLDIWLDLLSKASWFGHGGDQYACEGLVVAGPHNSFLNVLYHWGLVSFGAYCFMVAMLLRKLTQIVHKPTLVAGVSLLSGIGYSLLTGVLVTPLSQLLAVCVLGLFWGLLYKHSKVTCVKNTNQATNHMLIAVVCALTICLVSYRVYIRVDNYPILDSEMVYKPQFWLGYNCLTKPQLP